MDRAEVHRRRTVRLTIGFAALTLVVLALLALTIFRPGESSTAEASSAPRTIASASTPDAPKPEAGQTSAPAEDVQRLVVAIGAAGYEPSILSAKAGIPIELTVAQGDGCAAGFLVPELGIEMNNSAAAATRNLGALKAGDYRFTCAMEMVEGVLRVR